MCAPLPDRHLPLPAVRATRRHTRLVGAIALFQRANERIELQLEDCRSQGQNQLSTGRCRPPHHPTPNIARFSSSLRKSAPPTLAHSAGVSPALLLLTALPHALLELTAVFLPLAAWTIAGRRDEWDQLLAATFVTVGLAIPMLLVSATWETYVWPYLLRSASPSI